MPLDQECKGILILGSGGGRLSKCSKLTVDYSESLGGVNRGLL